MEIVSGGLLMISGACLALGIIHLRFWLAERSRRDYLAFAVVCFSFAVFAGFERSIALSATPAESLFYARWSQIPGSIALISTAWFAYLHLHGRRWLFWTYSASRILVLTLNFVFPNGINYREITAIKNVSILGETASYPIAVPNPWMLLVQFSHVLLIIFCIDASILAWRRGSHRKALVFGIGFLLFALTVLIYSMRVLAGFFPFPIIISFTFLFIVAAMVEQLSLDLVRSAILSGKLIELIRNLMNSQDKERASVAYELQEDLSQSLALFSIRLDELRREPANPEYIKKQVDRLDLEIGNLTSDLNRISHELHPAKLRLLGLEATLRGFCREFAAANRIDFEFAAENLPLNLPEDISLCLYRVTQETLQNVAEHSDASKANVNIKLEEEEIRLTIFDNGKGFDPKAARAKDSFGLIRIDERIRAVNGRLKVESKPGAGARIEARVPVSQEIISLAG